MRLLLIEDDKDLYDALKKCLHQEGYDCDVCESGADAEYYLTNGGYNAVILDRLLPGKDGLTILREMRARGDLTPVLMLTALDTVKDRTDGLDTGADDYLVKPFAMPELLSRIRALVRRPPTYRENAGLRFDDLLLDVRSFKLTCGRTEQTLSRKETAVMELFFENPGRVLSRAEILARGWGGAALAVLLCRGVASTAFWPQSFLPTKWSDFAFWGNLADTWRSNAKACALATQLPKEIELFSALRRCAAALIVSILSGGWCAAAFRAKRRRPNIKA